MASISSAFWRRAVARRSDDVGLSQPGLDALVRWLDKTACSEQWGCLLLKRSRLVLERYANGFRPDSLFEIGSIRKSFNSALMGIGLQEGLVALWAPAVDWWPELVEISGEPADRAITSSIDPSTSGSGPTIASTSA